MERDDMGPVRKWLLRAAIGIPLLCVLVVLVLLLLLVVIPDSWIPAEYRRHR